MLIRKLNRPVLAFELVLISRRSFRDGSPFLPNNRKNAKKNP